MLWTALALDVDGTLPRTMLWGLLAGATTTLLLGLGVAWCYMVPKYRTTFYKVRATTTRTDPSILKASAVDHAPNLHSIAAYVAQNMLGRMGMGAAHGLHVWRGERWLEGVYRVYT